LFQKVPSHLDITAFIRELLFGHDCVIIPGFGGFIGNYIPARIDKSTGTFFPPVKKISFNRNLDHNDGLLVGKISLSTGASYGDARNMVEEFARKIQNKLAKGEKVVFDNIGSFTHNNENNIQFEPDRNANYHIDSYGLESFQYIPLEGYDIRKRIIRRIDKNPVRQAAIRKNLWGAAVAIPLLAILIIIPLKTDLFKNKVDTTTLNPLVTAEFENNRNAIDKALETDSAMTGDTSQVTTETEDSLFTKSEEVTIERPTLSVPAEENIYCVITGSFKSEENAVSYAKLLKTEGFDSEIILAPNGFFRVSALRFSDMNTALFKRDSILKKFPGAWITKK